MVKKREPRNPKGRKRGTPNKATIEFKEAVTNLINYATPQMTKWLSHVASEDPSKALDHVYKFAQFGFPLLARTDVNHSGAIANTHDEFVKMAKEKLKQGGLSE